MSPKYMITNFLVNHHLFKGLLISSVFSSFPHNTNEMQGCDVWNFLKLQENLLFFPRSIGGLKIACLVPRVRNNSPNFFAAAKKKRILKTNSNSPEPKIAVNLKNHKNFSCVFFLFLPFFPFGQLQLYYLFPPESSIRVSRLLRKNYAWKGGIYLLFRTHCGKLRQVLILRK